LDSKTRNAVAFFFGLMAQQLLQPTVTEFIEVVSQWGDAAVRTQQTRAYGA